MVGGFGGQPYFVNELEEGGLHRPIPRQDVDLGGETSVRVSENRSRSDELAPSIFPSTFVGRQGDEMVGRAEVELLSKVKAAMHSIVPHVSPTDLINQAVFFTVGGIKVEERAALAISPITACSRNSMLESKC